LKTIKSLEMQVAEVERKSSQEELARLRGKIEALKEIIAYAEE
jgi:hypothetical protein